MKPVLLALTISIALGASSLATASGFRCGSHLVEEGMSLDKVRERCGDPAEETDDRWVYDRGPEQLLIVIHVAPDGTVSLIEERPHD